MEMLLTGEPIDSDEALQFGLVSQVFPDNESLMEGAMELAQKIAAKPMLAAGFVKRAVR